MNNDRRKQIKALYPQCETLRSKIEQIKALIEEAKEEAEELRSDIEGIREEEQEVLDNTHENLQQGDRYQAGEAAVNQMDEAMEALEDIDWEQFDIDDIVSYLDEAAA